MAEQELPLLVGFQGFARLLGVSASAVRAWRSRLDHDMPIRPGVGYMLREHVADGERMLWYTDGAVQWAVRNGLLESYPAPFPPRRPVMTALDIANRCGVAETTVRKAWRATPERVARMGLTGPSAGVLPQPDLVVEQVPLWYPVTITEWGLAVGRFLPVGEG